MSIEYFDGMIDLASDNGIGKIAIVAFTVPVTFPGNLERIGFGSECEIHSCVLAVTIEDIDSTASTRETD